MNVHLDLTPDELAAFLRAMVVNHDTRAFAVMPDNRHLGNPTVPPDWAVQPGSPAVAPPPVTAWQYNAWMANASPTGTELVIPPLPVILGTAQAILSGAIAQLPAGGGGPGTLAGMPSAGPRPRPHPARVAAVSQALLEAQMTGQIALGQASNGMITPGQIDDLAERVLQHLDAGSVSVLPPPIRQGVQAPPPVHPDVAASMAAVRQAFAAAPVAARPPPAPPPEVVAAFHAAIVDCARGLVEDALHPYVPAPTVITSPPAPSAGPAVPVNSRGEPSADAGGSPSPVEDPDPAVREAQERAKRTAAFHALEVAVRAILPFLRSLCAPRGGLIAYILDVLASVPELPRHLPAPGNDGPLLARVTAATLVGSLSTRGIGLQPLMERDHWSATTDPREPPKPGMLDVDDGGREWNVMERNPKPTEKG